MASDPSPSSPVGTAHASAGIKTTRAVGFGGVAWLRVWIKACAITPIRRVTTVWLGVVLVLSPIIGGNGMPLRGLAQLLLTPSLGLAFATMWLMLLWPAARLLLHTEHDRYLRSLPHQRWQRWLLLAGLFLWMQMPVVVVIATLRPFTAVFIGGVLAATLLLLSLPTLSAGRIGQPSWRSTLRACVEIYHRGVWRKNGTAMVRVVGFCLLAGAALGAMLKNNGVADDESVSLSLALLPVLCVPSVLPLLVALLQTKNGLRWLFASYGVAQWQQWLAWLMAVAGCLIACTLLVVVSASIFGRFGMQAVLQLTALSVLVALSNSAMMANYLLWAARSKSQMLALTVMATIGVQVAIALTVAAAGVQSLLPLVGTALWSVARCRKSFQ